MKSRFLLIATIAASLCSCSREMNTTVVDGAFTATLEEQVDVKTSLAYNKVFWTNGDQINIITDSANECYSLVSGHGTMTGGFSGNPISGSTFYAVYPYDAAAILKSGRIVTTFPKEQIARVNNVADGANLAIACSTSSSLQFKNVGALVKFTISSDNISEVVISSNNGEIIAGTVSIDWNSGAPTYLMGSEKYTQISVKPAAVGQPFAKGDYYAAILPRNFTKGITVTYKPMAYTVDAVTKSVITPADVVKQGKSAVNLQRSHILPVGDIAADYLWTYNAVTVNCLRDSDNTYGQYIDFNSGRTFSAIGGGAYQDVIDLAFMQWSGGGFCSISDSYTSSITNATNLGRYGSYDLTRDNVSNWSTRRTTYLCYLPSMTDSDYASITKVSQLKALFDTVDPVTRYYSNSNSEGTNLGSAGIQNGTQRYCIFKVSNPKEGTGYGIMKFTGINGVSGAWKIFFNYKFGTIAEEVIPEVDPIQPAGSPLLIEPYGICAHLCGDEKPLVDDILSDVKSMNVNWVRTDFNWSYINSAPGSWNYSFMDAEMASAKTRGVHLLPILAYDVEWCRPVVDYLDDWEVYVRNVVNRFKDQTKCWEVYNEPNHASYWHGESPNAVRYTQLLKRTYEIIKDIDPNLSVLAGGLAGIPLAYMETCLQNGAANYCDAFNFHPYHIDGVPEDLEKNFTDVFALFDKYNCKDKPLWITEVGWPTPPTILDIGVSEYVQALYVPRTYILSFAHGLNRVFWFEYRAPETAADNYRHHYGLTHSDLTIKQSHTAYEVLVSKLPSGSTRPVLTKPSSSIYLAHWKNPAGKDVWTYWSKDGFKSATLDWTGTIESAVNVFGAAVSPAKGDITVTTGCTYITGPTSLTLTAK